MTIDARREYLAKCAAKGNRFAEALLAVSLSYSTDKLFFDDGRDLRRLVRRFRAPAERRYGERYFSTRAVEEQLFSSGESEVATIMRKVGVLLSTAPLMTESIRNGYIVPPLKKRILNDFSLTTVDAVSVLAVKSMHPDLNHAAYEHGLDKWFLFFDHNSVNSGTIAALFASYAATIAKASHDIFDFTVSGAETDDVGTTTSFFPSEILLSTIDDKFIDRHDSEGWTPLHYAAAEGNTDEISRLCDLGAKITCNKRGTYPIDLARIGGDMNDIALLEAASMRQKCTNAPAERPRSTI